MLLNKEQIAEANAFLEAHKSELSPLEYDSASLACKQAAYYYIDGSNSDGYDLPFYCAIIENTIFGFVQPDPNSDWYLHPEDFPAFYERRLFN